MARRTAGAIAVAMTMGVAVGGARAQTAVPRPIVFSQTFAEPTYGTRSGYDLLAIADTVEYARPGEPTLPARRILVLLPPNGDVQSVSATAVGTRPLGRSLYLYPGQPPIEAGEATRAFTPPDATVYASSNIYPAQRAHVDFVSSCQGYRIAAVTIHPTVYSPRTRTVLFAPRVDLSLTLKSAGAPPFNPERRITDWVKSRVVNPGMAASYLPPPPKPKDAEYLIITRAMFVDALKPLAEHKNKHITTKILTVERIGSWYPGVDVQERIRSAIADHYLNHGTRFVLLAGDTPNFEQMLTPIEELALSADGARFAALGDDGRLSYGFPAVPFPLSAVPDGSPAAQFPLWSTPGVSSPITISADGGYIAAGRGGSLVLLGKSGGAPLWTLNLPADVSAVAMSPDGQYVAAGDESGRVHVCRVQGGGLVSHKEFVTEGAVSQIEVQAAGTKILIAAANDKGRVHLYRGEIAQELWSVTAGWMPCVSMSSTRLMVGTSSPDGGTVAFYDTTATPPALVESFSMPGEYVDQVEIGDRYALAVCIDQGGSYLAEFSVAPSGGGTISYIADIDWNGQIEVSRIGTSYQSGMLMTQAHAHFAISDGRTVSCFSGPSEGVIVESLWSTDTGANVRSVALSADRSRVVAGLDTGEVLVYSAKTGELMTPPVHVPLRLLTKAKEAWAIPVRYAITEGLWWLPTDYYYSDLDGVWDVDKDGVFGEMPPGSKVAERDYFPEVYVGRFSARDDVTMRAIVEKTIGYATVPHTLSPAAFFAGKSPMKENFKGAADGIISSFMGGKEFYAYYADNGTLAPVSKTPNPTGYDMHHFIDEVNTHDPAVVFIAEHGSPSGTWFVDTSVPGKIANTGFLMFALSCSTATPDEEAASLGEAMLLDPDGSAVGYIGGYDVISTGSASLAHRVFEQLYAKKNTRQGQALATAKMEWYKSGITGWTADQCLLVNLLGDPELNLAGGE